MRRVLGDNGLSIVLVTCFMLFWAGQSVAGHREHNADQIEHGESPLPYLAYLRSAHFWEATAENWESEFLQIFSYVILTAMLFQRGSAESKDPDQAEPVDRDPRKSRSKRMPLGLFAGAASRSSCTSTRSPSAFSCSSW